MIPLDMSIRLEKIAAVHPSAHIFMSKDVSSVANTGCIIVKNSPWARRFILEWINVRNYNGVINEQLGFQYLFRRNIHNITGFQSRIAILPEAELNSIFPSMTMQGPSHKILHLAAESDRVRGAIFAEARWEVCNGSMERREYRHQFGVTREKQLSIGIKRLSILFLFKFMSR